MDKQAFRLLVFVLLSLTIASGFLIFIKKSTYNKVLADVQLPINPNPISQTSTSSVTAPDGGQTLIMNLQTSGNLKNYTFTSSKLSFTKTVPSTSTISLPYNAWSPDDNRVFIKEDTGSQINFYEEPGDINVTNSFIQKFPNYKFQDVTGWAAPTLLVINANNGTNDVSFWFDLTSQSFIPLSIRFN